MVIKRITPFNGEAEQVLTWVDSISFYDYVPCLPFFLLKCTLYCRVTISITTEGGDGDELLD